MMMQFAKNERIEKDQIRYVLFRATEVFAWDFL